MTATLNDEVAELRRANAELQQRLDEALGERDEAVEQQTATAEVLQVINASPGDLAPVFDAMLEKAMRLCEAAFGGFGTWLGDRFTWVAERGIPEPLAKYNARNELTVGPRSAYARMARDDGYVQSADISVSQFYAMGEPYTRAIVDLGGARTTLSVPLVKDDKVLGVLGFFRQEVRPFSDKQIALVKNFAAQAVIAMENARLIAETREALEQQTATAEVLGVINASPGDLAPVFEAMLEKAMQLCEAEFEILNTYDGENYHRAAARGVPPAFEEWRRRQGPMPSGRGTNYGRITSGEKEVLHTQDLMAEDSYRDGDPDRRAFVELAGARTALVVALRKEGTLLGTITIFRQEVRPFTDKQIALLQNFAAQAVIAMENARLINETREALEQQTATAEVLGVINSSPGELAPVFQVILEKAHALCDADHGTLTVSEGEHFRAVAMQGMPEAFAAILRRPFYPTHGFQDRLLYGEGIVHISDITTLESSPDNPVHRAAIDLGKVRTLLIVALRKDGVLLGYITANRQEVRPFSEKQIALLQNFAAQAVIAMENARLLGELRQRTDDLQESLEYQTATSDVLKVISGSSFDVQPVFETILETAVRLCDSDIAHITNREGNAYRVAATFGGTLEWDAFMRGRLLTADRGSVNGRAALEGQVIHVHDLAADPEFTLTESITIGKNRTSLGVPLLREGIVVGVICLGRMRVLPFTDRQIELVRTFADQAVIAMENARLITETREALEQQTATAEVLGVINSSPGELAPVFDAMLQKALVLCEAAFGVLWTLDKKKFHAAAMQGVPLAFADFIAPGVTVDPNNAYALIRPGGPMVHIADAMDTEPYRAGDPLRRALVDLGGARTALSVPLRRDDSLLGMFMIYRKEVRPFADKQIALIQNFAAQAVIAMENARLINETREARDDAEGSLRKLKAAQANLIQAEKMASLGQLTAGIAHEIKNPLNFVNNFASLSVELLEELKEATDTAVATLDEGKRAEIDETLVMLSGNLEKIAEHGKRADNIVKSMLEHSRGVTGERREVDLNQLVEEALNLAYHGARAQDQSFNITLERDYAGNLTPIGLAPQEITRVFLNLFGNGFYAANKRARANGDGSFRPVLAVATCEAEDAVEVRVRDNGTGIPPEIRDKLFQPFFTTKPTGEGTGLGLSISYDIVTQQHGGTITVDSEPGSFTEFTVRLPRH